MVSLELQEFDLLSTLILVDGASLSMTSVKSRDATFQLQYPVQVSLLLILKLLDLVLQIVLAMLSLQLLAHSESHRAVIQGLVGLNVGVDVSLDAQKEKTALWHVQSDLADDLLKALLEEFLTNGADATLTSLPLHELLIEHLSEARYIDSGSRLRAGLLHPLLSYIQTIQNSRVIH